MKIQDMFRYFLKKLNIFSQKNDEAINEVKELLLINLKNLDHTVAQEITNLAVHSCNIQRQIKILQKDGKIGRDDLIKYDTKAMSYEEGIYQRMEIRQLIRKIVPLLETEKNWITEFLKTECDKHTHESWLFYLNTLLPGQKSDLHCDYAQVLYLLAIMLDDINSFDPSKETNSSGNSGKSNPEPQVTKPFSFTRPF